MKKYRKLVPVVMILLMIVSWYKLISDTVKENNKYTEYVEQARQYAAKGITKYALASYNEALAMKPNVELYIEVAHYYRDYTTIREYTTWCEKVFDLYPTDEKAYECVLEAYMKQNDYASCYGILETANKRSVSSDYIKQVSEEIKYCYKMDFESYDDVGVFGYGCCAVNRNGVWGYINSFGQQLVAYKYKDASAFTNSGYASVRDTSDSLYFIDSSGYKVIVPNTEYVDIGLLASGVIAVKKQNGKYEYVDKQFVTKLGEYDYASTMNGNIAAVKEGNQWSVINNEGKKTTENQYGDIKLDEKNVAYMNERLFVQQENKKYIMINSDGKQIGNTEYEDAKVFGDLYAAVKVGGKWGFADKEGNMVIEAMYEDARSFTSGMAAVKLNGKWGFIDKAGDMQIKNEYEDAKDFNSKGSCFVKVGNKWQLLKLYRLNR